MLNESRLYKVWIGHLRYWNGLSLFPREFGLKRAMVFKEVYIASLLNQYNKNNCYTSVYSEEQLKQKMYDTIFLEARDEVANLDEAIEDRDTLRGIFSSKKIDYIDFYSGGRSYHFYLNFLPIYIPNLRATVLDFVERMDIRDLLDMHPAGNRRAMGRIPGTLNERTGRFAVYSDAEDAASLEFESANNFIPDNLVSSFRPTKILDYLIPVDDYTTEVMKPSETAFGGIFPDCILNILSKLVFEHHVTHAERIHLTAFLHQIGKSEEEIIDVFSTASDYNPAMTAYQVRRIITQSLRPYSCNRIKREIPNICPYSDTHDYCSYIHESNLTESKLTE